MADLVEIADGVVAALNGAPAGWPVAFTAVRKFVPKVKLADMAVGGAPLVTVVPADAQSEPSSRSQWQDDVQIDIAVQAKVANDLAAVEPLMGLVKAMKDWFKSAANRRLSTLPDWVITGVGNAPPVHVTHLDNMLAFTSVISVSLRTIA